LVERGVEVDHVTVLRWVQRFTPLLADAARFSARRDAAAARRLFQRAPRMLTVTPGEVATDAAPVHPAVLDDLIPWPGTTSSGTPTIRSRPITAGSHTGHDRCAGCGPTGPHK
jgi:transposase-like protein